MTGTYKSPTPKKQELLVDVASSQVLKHRTPQGRGDTAAVRQRRISSTFLHRLNSFSFRCRPARVQQNVCGGSSEMKQLLLCSEAMACV